MQVVNSRVPKQLEPSLGAAALQAGAAADRSTSMSRQHRQDGGLVGQDGAGGHAQPRGPSMGEL